MNEDTLILQDYWDKLLLDGFQKNKSMKSVVFYFCRDSGAKVEFTEITQWRNERGDLRRMPKKIHQVIYMSVNRFIACHYPKLNRWLFHYMIDKKESNEFLLEGMKQFRRMTAGENRKEFDEFQKSTKHQQNLLRQQTFESPTPSTGHRRSDWDKVKPRSSSARTRYGA
jgi:hypothetical protein